MTEAIELKPCPDDGEDYEREPICPVTGTYCDGNFCDEYGCAKEAGFYDKRF